MTTVFHRVGRYEIHQRIGRGGMAEVFLATDTDTGQRVALKLVPIEADRDGQEVLEAERWGAKLQEEFFRESRFVPAVYACGTQGQYFYIAMEYLDGRNLSEVIGEGPMPGARAVRVATQLCEFLEAAATFERTLDGRTFTLLLHGDLKPRNIRVLDGDEIKVFDFGIAKALSLSRKVTRNDFGSIAYLSPERLESGEIDPQAEFWAVGVLLYEMVSGVQPFRAADTRRLEQRIRARTPPTSLDGLCPTGLQAIVAKLLAPATADRYASATAIREDLLRFTAGEPVQAEIEGWPHRRHDEPATRRTHRPAAVPVPTPVGLPTPSRPLAEEEVTRRTAREASDVRATTAVAAPAIASASVISLAPQITPPVVAATPATVPTATPAVAAPATTSAPAAPVPRRGLRRYLRKTLLAIAILLLLNEVRIYMVASALAQNVPQDYAGAAQMWNQYTALQGWSLNIGVAPLERALVAQATGLSDRTFARYRAGSTTVFEREWRQARDALDYAVSVRRRDARLAAAQRYAEGHLRRINGEARLKDNLTSAAQEDLAESVRAFREAAERRPNWPDPFLGLMRTFIAMEDIERGADALAQAQRYGYSAGNRDWALLGDGYLKRADKLATSEELEPLTRAADAYSKAIEHLSKAGGLGSVALRLREAQRRQRDVQARIDHLSASEPHEQTT